MGQRGSGKTVTLTESKQRPAASGMDHRLSRRFHRGNRRQGPPSNRACPRCPRGRRGRRPRQRTARRWSGIRLGPFSPQRAVLAEVRSGWDMRHLLAKLAEHAQKAGVGVLMTLDEVHSGDRNELRRLSAGLQHITKRGQPRRRRATGARANAISPVRLGKSRSGGRRRPSAPPPCRRRPLTTTTPHPYAVRGWQPRDTCSRARPRQHPSRPEHLGHSRRRMVA